MPQALPAPLFTRHGLAWTGAAKPIFGMATLILLLMVYPHDAQEYNPAGR
jgi:hypothetical protein